MYLHRPYEKHSAKHAHQTPRRPVEAERSWENCTPRCTSTYPTTWLAKHQASRTAISFHELALSQSLLSIAKIYLDVYLTVLYDTIPNDGDVDCDVDGSFPSSFSHRVLPTRRHKYL